MNECPPMKTNDFTRKLQEYKNNNPNNFEGIFQHANADHIEINFMPTMTPVNMEVIIIKQNLQRIIGGMTGNSYSS